MSANLKNSAVATGLEKVSFYSYPKERQCQRMLKLPHNWTHLTCYKVVLKILQDRLQQYMNWELPDVQVGFRKGRGTKYQIANIHWIIEKAREFQKNIYFCFNGYAKVFVWIMTNCGKFFKRWEYQTTWPASWETCMHSGQEAAVRTGHGTTDWFKIGKEVLQGCIL